MIHLLVSLSDRQSADGVAVEIQFGDILRMLNTDIIEDRSLIDSEKKLMRVYRIGK